MVIPTTALDGPSNRTYFVRAYKVVCAEQGRRYEVEKEKRDVATELSLAWRRGKTDERENLVNNCWPLVDVCA